MHWTLLVLIGLSALCVVLNVAQAVLTRSVRVAGLLICGAWAAQQTYWARHGADSIELFVVCDALIIAWFFEEKWLSRRSFDARERIIAATIPLTTALGAYAWLRGGHTFWSWSINWTLVAGQMVAGLPTPWLQRAGDIVNGRAQYGSR